jgi:hypothetical protein
MKQALLIVIAALVWAGCKSTATYPIDEPTGDVINDGLVGKWKMEEDTDKRNYYLVEKWRDPGEYHIKFYNRGGTNRTYESMLHYSIIDGQPFINARYFDLSTGEMGNFGYFFLKVTEANKDYSKITLSLVGDTTMRGLTSSAEVKARIAANLHKRSFYSETVHMFKVWM